MGYGTRLRNTDGILDTFIVFSAPITTVSPWILTDNLETNLLNDESFIHTVTVCRRCVLAPPSKWLPSRGSLLRTWLCVITDSEKTSGNKTSGWRFQVASSLCHIQQCRRIVSSWSSLWPSSAAAPVKVKKKIKFVNKLLLCCFPPCPCLKPNLVISPVRQMLQPNGEKKKGKKWTRVGLILYCTTSHIFFLFLVWVNSMSSILKWFY